MQTSIPKRRRWRFARLEGSLPLLVATLILLPLVRMAHNLGEMEEARYSSSSGPVSFPVNYEGPRKPHAAVLLSDLSSRVLISYGRLLTVRDSEDPLSARWSETLPAEVQVATLSGDGSRVAVAFSDGAVQLWDINARSWHRKLRSDARVATCLEFSPDGSRLLIAGADGTAAVWNVDRRVSLGFFSPNDSVNCTAAALSSDGKTAAVGTASGACFVWNVDAPGEARHVTGLPVPLTAIALNQDGTCLVTANENGAISCRDPATGELQREFQPVHGSVTSILFLPDGRRFVTGHTDGAVMMWACATLLPLRTFYRAAEDPGQVVSMSVSAGGTRLQVLEQDETVIVWEPLTEKQVALYEFGPGNREESFLAW